MERFLPPSPPSFFLSGRRDAWASFLVLMLYASLDRLCQIGMERKLVRPLETQEAASVLGRGEDRGREGVWGWMEQQKHFFSFFC